MTPRIAARHALLAFLAVYGFVIMRDPDYFGLLDNVDLAIHETGHLVFAPFGEWMTAFGGTLFQLVVPLTFVGYFLRRGEWFGGSVCLWWVAHDDEAVDGQEREEREAGGDAGGHAMRTHDGCGR